MSWLSSLCTLIKALPEVLALLEAIKVAIEKAEHDREVSEDLNAIKKAFAEGDASQLNDLFSKPN